MAGNCSGTPGSGHVCLQVCCSGGCRRAVCGVLEEFRLEMKQNFFVKRVVSGQVLERLPRVESPSLWVFGTCGNGTGGRGSVMHPLGCADGCTAS